MRRMVGTPRLQRLAAGSVFRRYQMQVNRAVRMIENLQNFKVRMQACFLVVLCVVSGWIQNERSWYLEFYTPIERKSRFSMHISVEIWGWWIGIKFVRFGYMLNSKNLRLHRVMHGSIADAAFASADLHITRYIDVLRDHGKSVKVSGHNAYLESADKFVFIRKEMLQPVDQRILDVRLSPSLNWANLMLK